MTAFGLSDAERRNARAQAAGYRNHYERRKETQAITDIGFTMSDQANRRAFQGYLRAVNASMGLPGRATATRAVMQAFTGLVQTTNLARRTGGGSITGLLEDRGMIDPEEVDWEEWWSAYV